MSTYPSYNRSPKGKFNEDHKFSQVLIGSDAMLLEDELNEMQAIQNRRVDALYDLQDFDGVKTRFEVQPHPDDTRSGLYVIPEFLVKVAGYMIQVGGSGNDGQTAGIDSDSNVFQVEVPTEGSDDRYDLLILEVKEEVVSGHDTLYREGVQNTQASMENTLIDPRIGQETARRVQVQSRLRVLKDVKVTDISLETAPLALDFAQDPEGGDYSYDKNGRWRSENGYFAVPVSSILHSTDPFTPDFYSGFYAVYPKYALTYNNIGDISKVEIILAGRVVYSISIESSDERINRVTTSKEGLETQWDFGYSLYETGVSISSVYKRGY